MKIPYVLASVIVYCSYEAITAAAEMNCAAEDLRSVTKS